jgi:hypothetical protein
MKLKYIDGLKIRNTLDTDFGVIGSNKIYSYIPAGEIWFDKLYLAEKEHFLKIHLYELKLMKKMSYEKARLIIEKKFIEKINKNKIPNFVVQIKRYKGFIIKYVDGRIIRKYIDPKFILGMHGVGARDYSHIKNNEIWIDIRQKKPDQKYSLIHEYEEAKLMRKWGKYNTTSYNNAHDFALAYEKVARRKDGARYLKD